MCHSAGASSLFFCGLSILGFSRSSCILLCIFKGLPKKCKCPKATKLQLLFQMQSSPSSWHSLEVLPTLLLLGFKVDLNLLFSAIYLPPSQPPVLTCSLSFHNGTFVIFLAHSLTSSVVIHSTVPPPINFLKSGYWSHPSLGQRPAMAPQLHVIDVHDGVLCVPNDYLVTVG